MVLKEILVAPSSIMFFFVSEIRISMSFSFTNYQPPMGTILSLLFSINLMLWIFISCCLSFGTKVSFSNHFLWKESLNFYWNTSERPSPRNDIIKNKLHFHSFQRSQIHRNKFIYTHTFGLHKSLSRSYIL